MAVTGTQIATLAGRLLLDEGHVRWVDTTELLDWIKEGRREMAVRKPAVFGTHTRAAHTLTSGCYQTLLTTGGFDGVFSISAVESNVSTGRAIRLTTREQLDAYRPTWMADTGTAVQNWFPDPSNPIGFWVYPASSGSQVYVRFNTAPNITSLNDTVLDFDSHAAILVNYVVYRAFSKEDEPGDDTKAQAYLQLFADALK